MSLEDAVGPNFKDVFKIAVKSNGYRNVPVFFWFPGRENNAEFVKKGYFNILWSVMYDTVFNYYIQLHESRE